MRRVMTCTAIAAALTWAATGISGLALEQTKGTASVGAPFGSVTASAMARTADLLCGLPPPVPKPEPEPEPSPEPAPEPEPTPDEEPSPDPSDVLIPTPANPGGALMARLSSVERPLAARFGEVVRSAEATSSPDAHDYFERLKSLSGALCAYSLRDQNQINRFSCAGSGCVNRLVTYDPTRDDYHTPQDAARVEIEDAETAPGSSLKNQVTLPVLPPGHDDGHTYVLTWDFWLGPEFQTENLVDPETGRQEIGGYKAFHIWADHDRSDGRRRDKFFRIGVNIGRDEVRLPEVGRVWYQVTRADTGPDVLDKEPLRPAETFSIEVKTWTRFWFVFTQNPGALDDKVSVWMADEHRAPVKTVDNLTIEIPYDPVETQIGLKEFTIQFNTSSRRRLGGGRLIAYVRNAVLLQHDGNLTTLLESPR